MFELYHARLSGIAHCIVPQRLPIVEPDPSLVQAPMELLANMMPNQALALGGNQIPSIVQIIVPAEQIPNLIPIDHAINQTIIANSEIVTAATPTTTSTTTTTLAPEIIVDDLPNENSTNVPALSTEEPTKSEDPMEVEQDPPVLTTSYPESDKDDDIDDIQLNEDDDYQENEEKIKKQRDKSDFRYVESFESEPKSNPQIFEPDPNDNDTELKNNINDNFQQIPSVLPVPKALSSSKDPEIEDEEPPELLADQNINGADI